MSTNKTQATLVKMANQIGLFFASQTPDDMDVSARALAGHLKLFWAPTMRARLVEQIGNGSTEGVDEIVILAVRNHRSTLLSEKVHDAAEAANWAPEGGGDAG